MNATQEPPRKAVVPPRGYDRTLTEQLDEVLKEEERSTQFLRELLDKKSRVQRSWPVRL